ncbi:hypothetical protein ET495_01980 [Xylanimonas allomyrinae]|uniref:Uncharacterized protein n=1 Tax=Xylanimonas allomyrinae TaxID=2509459 RepID=A0A4P6EKR9_9MICO|nr:hypothetical protein [Xylanimonas allomyrinae]QAY62243.1 hypothetical protein ET495_01980 [Xylanimonas allomyrinae]
MLTFVVWSLVAVFLVTAVFLVANVMARTDGVPGDVQPGGGLGDFWRSFRAGLRHSRRRRSDAPVDTDLEAFFAGTVEEGPAYVDAEQITDVLTRARQQASRQLHVGTARAPD